MDNNVIKIKLKTILTILLIIGIAIMFLVIYYNTNLTIYDYNKEISIKIRCAYAYNVETADALNDMSDTGDYIDILEITLDGNDLEKITNLLEKQSFKKVDDLKLVVLDEYEVSINDEFKLSICPGEQYAYYSKNNNGFLTKISDEFVNEIDRIVQEKVNESLPKFSSEMITILSEDNTQITITDEKHIKTLTENLKYTKVNIKENEMENEKISYVLDLNNGTKVYVYFASCIGHIIDDDTGVYYVAFITDYEDIVNNMFENYVSGRNESIDAEEIIVKYLGKEYYINNAEDVKYIIDTIKMCDYDSYDWLDNFSEDDYGNEDIVIEIGKCKVIIPGDRWIGNRYYIDEKNNAYMIWNLSELENYFKELVNYEN